MQSLAFIWFPIFLFNLIIHSTQFFFDNNWWTLPGILQFSSHLRNPAQNFISYTQFPLTFPLVIVKFYFFLLLFTKPLLSSASLITSSLSYNSLTHTPTASFSQALFFHPSYTRLSVFSHFFRRQVQTGWT